VAIRARLSHTIEGQQWHSVALSMYSSIHSAFPQHSLSVRFTQQRDHRAGGAQVRRRHATDGRKDPVGRGEGAVVSTCMQGSDPRAPW